LTGLASEKGPSKDHCEDYYVEKQNIPIGVLGETATCVFHDSTARST